MKSSGLNSQDNQIVCSFANGLKVNISHFCDNFAREAELPVAHQVAVQQKWSLLKFTLQSNMAGIRRIWFGIEKVAKF